MDTIETFAIIAAAGKGLRMGSKTKKQYLTLDGIPVLIRALMAMDTCDQISEMILVVPKDDRAFCKKNIIDPFEFEKPIHLVEGGRQRQDSVFSGLKQVQEKKAPGKETLVMIHDGVRPFVSRNIIKTCLDHAIEYGACIPVVKITDTVKVVGPDAVIQNTLNRSSLFGAQTPQAFRLELILRAYAYAMETSFSGTDEASLVEHLGEKVKTIHGSSENIKLTTQEDLVWGRYLLNQRSG